MLERAVGLVRLVTGQVNLAVPGDDRAVTLDEHLGVEAMPCAAGIGIGQLGVAEAEPDATPAGLVEQRLGVRTRHRRLVEVVELGDVLDEPPREERRQRQLREHDELATPLVSLDEQRQQPLDDVLAGVVASDRTELRRANRDEP